MDQLGALRDFKRRMQSQGLIGEFTDESDLTKVVNDAIDYDIGAFAFTAQELARNNSWPALKNMETLSSVIRGLSSIQRKLLSLIYNIPAQDDGSGRTDSGIYLPELKDKLGPVRSRSNPTNSEVAYRCKDLANAELIEIDSAAASAAYYYASPSVLQVTDGDLGSALKVSNTRRRTTP